MAKLRHVIGRTLALLTIAAAATLAATAPGQAQGYPSRPVRLVVPLAPGGPADTSARIFAAELADALGQNVLIENRSGASGIVGTEAVVKAAPDGYTLLLGSSSVFAVNPAVMTGLRFDVRRDLRLIGLVAQTEHLLAARPGLGVKTLGELLALAKAQPGKLSYASTGAGGIAHLATELLNHEAGIRMLHIPFRGGGPAVIGVLSNDADVLINDISTMVPHVKSAKLVPLALASARRTELLPDLATFAEQGLARVLSRSWYGLAAPAATPAEAIARLETATARIAAAPGFQAGLAKAGLQPLVMTPAETAAFIEEDLGKWARVAKAADIRVDQ